MGLGAAGSGRCGFPRPSRVWRSRPLDEDLHEALLRLGCGSRDGPARAGRRACLWRRIEGRPSSARSCDDASGDEQPVRRSDRVPDNGRPSARTLPRPRPLGPGAGREDDRGLPRAADEGGRAQGAVRAPTMRSVKPGISRGRAGSSRRAWPSAGRGRARPGPGASASFPLRLQKPRAKAAPAATGGACPP